MGMSEQLSMMPTPTNEDERRRVLEVANQPEFASLPPQQILARLADQGT